ncbi:YjbA family protein [Ornithinibacillus massiliensis]|uniref:YjbA family protein n=1 Tax=Ornithinibacillus massiliensis TaxID=1944633 RepID=A0ABS5MDR2_9BACI|nr:YjbA family protein [Ornithinibacillus massiliensis]MBS3680466.1 YjbA family protein [Ornithinibacillus massiliensis]
MLYLHDVWVNWFEGEENGYNVCYFHEWRKDDGIELLDQVPLLYITDSLYQYIENDMHDLPQGLLDAIYKRAYTRKGQERSVVDYACIVTDGNDIVAFDTIGYRIPIRKSRLIPRQEQLVYEMIEKAKPQGFGFDDSNYVKEYHMLSMAPELVFGLTRRERQLKQLLMMGLDQLRTSNNIEELRYWLTEWNPKKYPDIRYMDENEVWQALYDGVKSGWGLAHEELCEKLIKGQPFLEKMWELENNEVEGASKQKSKNQ